MLKKVTVAASLALCASTASAVPIPGLFGTGFDENGPLAVGAFVPNYSVDFQGSTVSSFVQNNLPSVWLANDGNSRWIGTSSNASNSAQSGNFTYTYTFDLTGFDASTAIITGACATDNELGRMLLNGSLVAGADCDGFASLTQYTLDTGFVSGTNTLAFTVFNAPVAGANPSGFRNAFLRSNVTALEVTAPPAAGVSEPAALLLTGLGLLSVGARRRTRRG